MSGLHSIGQSTISLFGVDVVVHQLNNGERVIEEGSLVALFEAMSNPGCEQDIEEVATAIREILS